MTALDDVRECPGCEDPENAQHVMLCPFSKLPFAVGDVVVSCITGFVYCVLKVHGPGWITVAPEWDPDDSLCVSTEDLEKVPT
ncbi:hypothetical protein ACFSYH_05935 [Populibacterium corticicola]|uniref:Uncharacterized protein n=1 Tax=Populibacterium corticicola TaxID=1812826 RepID=A0ABW5XDZ3_9MICO